MLTYQDLINIKVKETNEMLVSVSKNCSDIILLPPKDMIQYSGNDIYLRESVVNLLKLALNELHQVDGRYNLLLSYGYRHPEIQKAYFQKEKAIIFKNNPNLSEKSLIEATHKLIAVPAIAGHPSGGAVDLTLTFREKPIDMGTQIAEFLKGDMIQTFSDLISPTQRSNRLLLRKIMMNAGFAPFDGEWWHFSFGDREWACYYNQSHAIYDCVENTASYMLYR